MSSSSSGADRRLPRRDFLAVGAVTTVAAAKSLQAEEPGETMPRQAIPEVEALTFDVFGTVVDWRASIVRDGELLALRKGLDVDWPRFADRWRAGYGPAMNQVRTGELPWLKIDDLHRRILDELVGEFDLGRLSEEEIQDLNRVWHRLIPWPDSVLGLSRLKAHYVIATLSNGNVSLLTHMAKNAGLPWDCVLSAELAGQYKPDPEVYLKAADLLSLPTERVMMVAAHKSDLHAARAVGMRTAYVPRPLEYGPSVERDLAPDPEFDVVADDFIDLADQLRRG